MKYYLILFAAFLPVALSGQTLEEQRAQLDPRNYENGLALIRDTELTLRAADISEFTTLDSTLLIAKYHFSNPGKEPVDDNSAPEVMNLEVGDKWVKFHSNEAFVRDSTYTQRKLSGTIRDIIFSASLYQVFFSRTEHRYEIINRIPFHSGEAITVEDKRLPRWRTDTTSCTILGYRCMHATTDYRGRKWNVWFTPEIPVDAGPWKLTGLPGLILKAEDDEKAYSFVCTAIEQKRLPITRPCWRYRKMDRREWLKFEKRMHTAPYSLFGNNTIVISIKQGRLDETWEIPYIPIERE